MGVYIKGMEMPKSCLNCFLSRSGCRAVLKRMRAMEAGTWIPANYRHDDCPLVQVHTPHGRLIDADALMENEENISFKDEWHMTVTEAFVSVKNIAHAPTILEAEEGE